MVPPRLGLARWLPAILAAAVCIARPAAAQYQLGQGLDLGPFNLAGYASINAEFPEQGRRSLVLDDLSLFVAGHFDRWINPFVEAELTDSEIVHFGGGHGPTPNDYGTVERLYNDAYLGEGLTFRVGKMLSPVGEWNVIHATPLVLTTVRPAVTYRNFSEYASGVSLLYAGESSRSPSIQLYWQPWEELLQRSSAIAPAAYRDLEGARLSLPLSLLDQVGFSFQYNHTLSGEGQPLFGADAHYTLPGLVLQSEWTYSQVARDLSDGAHERARQWGGYVGVSHQFNDRWSVYGWWETFAARRDAAVAHDLLIGGAWRPHPAIVFKLEYLQNVGGPPVNPTGLFASWSILF